MGISLTLIDVIWQQDHAGL